MLSEQVVPTSIYIFSQIAIYTAFLESHSEFFKCFFLVSDVAAFYYPHTECLIYKMYRLNLVNVIATSQIKQLALNLKMDMWSRNIFIFPKFTSTITNLS